MYGASGSAGTFTEQLAKHYGAKVTAVCSSANTKNMIALGASQIIDYKTEDFTKKGQSYDIIVDAVGKISKKKSASLLSKNGSFVTVKSLMREDVQDFEYVLKLLESSHVNPLIDREYSLDQIVEAHRYVDSGRKKGNVAIRVAG